MSERTRVLVTGANGYLGTVVAATMNTHGFDVKALVHRDKSRIPQSIPVQVGDLQDYDSLRSAVEGVDVVCHLAGLTRARESVAEPLNYFDVNVGGTVTLLRAMESAAVQYLVFASTAAIYGTPKQQPMPEELNDNPPNPYAASKLAAESVIESQTSTGKLAAAVLRLFNVAGGADPDDTRIVPRILTVAAGRGSALTINGTGTAVRDFLHINDAATAFEAAARNLPRLGDCRRYNIGTGIGTSVNDLIATTSRITGQPVPVEHMAAGSEPQCLVSDSRRARRELGWSPTSSDLDKIVRDAWASLRSSH